MRIDDLLEVGKFQYPVKPGKIELPPENVGKNTRKNFPKSSQSFNFTTNSGIDYSVIITRRDISTGLAKVSTLELVFGISPPKDGPQNLTLKKTGTGDAIKIFSTVYRVLTDEMKENGHPDRIIFSGNATESTRIKLYDHIANNIEKYLPKYKLLNKAYRKYSDYWDYIFAKK